MRATSPPPDSPCGADPFWRLRRRIDLGYSEDERKQGFGLMQQFDQAAGAADKVV